MNNKQNIRRLSKDALSRILLEKGEKKFRVNQLHEWIWEKNAASFQDMSNLPKSMREMLEQGFYIHHAKVTDKRISEDKTAKMAFTFEDGQIAEGVLIPAKDRITACISSQSGCSLNCKFCATAALGLNRNLYPDEMTDQIVEINKIAEEKYGQPLSNIVLMGMGEPLMNYDNVVKTLRWLTTEEGAGISNRRITLSTVGIADKIRQLADDNVKVNLALSLHVANNEKRNKIIPVNKKFPLQALIDALTYFYQKTNLRLTIEYILFKGFNDTLEDASELADFCKHFPVKVNIIEYNPVKGSSLQKADYEDMNRFVEFLRDKINIIVNVRKSRGKDIDAACGQLANKLIC
ncbi:MAG: 23S rRNA (adenine(2503)-C(2))-methyltransferase RlmN [Bacteroidales bacterium]